MPAQQVARPGDGPTMHRILLGARLRQLRTEALVTLDEAAEAIRASKSKVSRLENGMFPVKERDVRDLLGRYRVTDEGRRRDVLAMVDKANRLGWWHPYRNLLPPNYARYLGLEEAASLIRVYDSQLVPALLQTEDYARAVLEFQYPSAPPDKLERGLRVRLDRQAVLAPPHGADPPTLWMIVDEAALRRGVGGPEVMAGQIDRLIRAAKEPNIALFVLPLGMEGLAVPGGGFTILRFAGGHIPDVVHVGLLTASVLMDRPSEVEVYMRAMDRFSIVSLSQEQTLEFLTAFRRDIDRTS